jgi:hypothetical protein
MQNYRIILSALYRLNKIQGPRPLDWVRQLSHGEKNLEVERLRSLLPMSVLQHHDRMINRSRWSLSIVHDGVCNACHLRLPQGNKKNVDGFIFDICMNCGVFLKKRTGSSSPTLKKCVPQVKVRSKN